MTPQTAPPHPIPNAGYRAWSLQCCRSCYAWLPSMDLRLKPAHQHQQRVKDAVLAGAVTDDDFHASHDLGQRGVV